MYRIDCFLKYYNSLSDTQVEIEKGIWVNAKPVNFSYGIITKKYWLIKYSCLKDAVKVFLGKADAVTWNK